MANLTVEKARTIKTAAAQLIQDLRKMEELKRKDADADISVSAGAYADAQESAKEQVQKLIHECDSVIDGTDTFEDEEGSTVSLPNAALSRTQNKDLPPAP